MASPIDVVTPFDPTGYGTLTGADLQQFGSGIAPYLDKGFIVYTTDIAGVPQVPDAATETKWQRYIWLRQDATAISAYIWNTTKTSDVTYLKWVSINAAIIGAGSIQGYMIANNTITDVNILNVDYSKLTGAPANLPPSGSAGGDLTGTYPNPSVAALAITSSKIALSNITTPLIADLNVTPSKLSLGTASQQIRTNAGVTSAEWFTPQVIVNTANPAGVGDAGKFVKVNAAGTGYELTATAVSAVSVFRVAATPVATGGFIAATAHGLGAVPDSVQAFLVCTSADAGYAVGDMIPVAAAAAVTPTVDNANPFAPGADATNVWCTYAPAGTTNVYIPTKTANTVTNIAATILTKWSVKLIAIRYT